MTITITSAPDRTIVLSYLSIPTFNSIAMQLFAKLRPQFKSEDRAEEAIETLRDASASPDMCDWAERYLCGMKDADASRYCESRRWQS
jgi:hypothetical protein